MHDNASILRRQHGRPIRDSNPYAEILSADLTNYRRDVNGPPLCERPPLYARPLDEEEQGPIIPDRGQVGAHKGPLYDDTAPICEERGPVLPERDHGSPNFGSTSPKPNDNDYEKLDKKHSYIDIIADTAPIVPNDKYAALVKENKDDNIDMNDVISEKKNNRNDICDDNGENDYNDNDEYAQPYGNKRQPHGGPLNRNMPNSENEVLQPKNGDTYKIEEMSENEDNNSCDNLNNNTDDIAMYENRNLYMSGEGFGNDPIASHQGQSVV